VWREKDANDNATKKAGQPLSLTPHNAQASWNLKDAAFTAPGKVAKLNLLGLYGILKGPHRQPDQKQFNQRLGDILIDFAVQLNVHKVVAEEAYSQLSNSSNDKGLAEELVEWFKSCGKDDLTMILLESKDYAKYSVIKRTCDIQGMQTICAIGKKIHDRGSPRVASRWQFLSNLALKVNMKMSGDSYWLDSSVLEKLLGGAERKERTMIMGS
jgi:hypothetical protein